LHDGRTDQFAFEGEALHPVALSPDGPIEFELVAHRTSITMLLDPATAKLQTASRRHPTSDHVASPDGNWIAFTSTNQIWLRSVVQGTVTQLTGGNCNSFSPAWELNSQAIIFASDCSRGIGLPALYRARIQDRIQR
jgi:Tol biopolymer transport system component